MDITTKSIFGSAWVIAVIFIALLTTGLLPVVLGAVLVGLFLWLLYSAGVRVHRRATGKKSKTVTEVTYSEGGDDGV